METPTQTINRSHATQRFWLWQVTALALFLGLLLGTVLRAQRNFREHKIYLGRNGVPPFIYAEQVDRNKELEDEIKRLNAEKSRLESAVSQGATGTKKLQALNRELQDTKEFAGLTAVSGPGVVVTLRDAPKEEKTLGYPAEEFIIHDMDIFQIVNELRAAGAEAVAINDQRLTGTSPIRCEGPTVRVNQTEVGVPLQIKAIGDPVALYSGLSMTGGVLDPTKSTLAYLKMVTIAKEQNVSVPAFAGPTTFQHARPAQ